MVHTRFGIDLSKKRTLIHGRLNGILRSLGYTSFTEYVRAVDDDHTGQRLLDMIDRLSTNHTFFFREADHLDRVAGGRGIQAGGSGEQARTGPGGTARGAHG